MPLGLVIFDCDGVLVDSQPVLDRVLRDALAEQGLALSVGETSRRFVGLSYAATIVKIEAMLGRALPKDFIDSLKMRERAALPGTLKPVAGVSEAVTSIVALAVPICVASNGGVPLIQANLKATGLLPHFDGRLFSAEQVENGKPHPDLFLYAAAQMGEPPSRCAVVEDSVPGVQAGVAAGMTVLAYAERTDPAALRRAGGRVFTSMGDLPSLLGLGPV